jgi:hypothetical protein
MTRSIRLARFQAGQEMEGAEAALDRILAERGGGGALNARTTRPAPASRAKAADTAPRITQSDVNGAYARGVAQGIAQERTRVASVFAADASKGRERMCARLLTSPKGFSASSIIAELPNLGTDRSGSRGGSNVLARTALVRGSGNPAKAKAASDAWDKIHAEMGAEGAGGSKSTKSASAAWDQVYADLTKGAAR